MQVDFLVLLYLIPVLGIVVWYWRRHQRLERESFAALKERGANSRIARTIALFIIFSSGLIIGLLPG